MKLFRSIFLIVILGVLLSSSCFSFPEFFEEEMFLFEMIQVDKTPIVKKQVITTAYFSTPYENIVEKVIAANYDKDNYVKVKPVFRENKNNEKVKIIVGEGVLLFDTVKVKVNQPVVWQNEQEKLKVLIYGVREISDMKSGYLNPGESFSWTFTEPGEYQYVDSVVIGRMGKIIVY